MLKTLTQKNQTSLRQVLVIVHDATIQQVVDQQLSNERIELTVIAMAKEATTALAQQSFDCIVVDVNQPDSVDSVVIATVHEQTKTSQIPVVVYTGEPITSQQQRMLDEFKEKMIIKGAGSPQQLLDEVILFTHLAVDALRDDQQKALNQHHNEDDAIKNSRILLVDDDMRNMFALTRTLENNGLNITQAENGQAAIDTLTQSEQPFDLILMDIMMPIMDGYEAIQRIRQMQLHQSTPIIALTAKAMPADRQKCIKVGASQYLTKPLDIDELMLMLRVWLYKRSSS